MTSLWSRVGLGLVIVGLTQVNASATIQNAAPRPTPTVRPAPPPKPPQTPRYLRERIDALGREFDGQVGIAVKSVEDGWATGWNYDTLCPQQSVSKLWVAITALDAVDKGRVKLTDKVSLSRSDLTLFHQPIAAKVLEVAVARQAHHARSP